MDITIDKNISLFYTTRLQHSKIAYLKIISYKIYYYHHTTQPTKLSPFNVQSHFPDTPMPSCHLHGHLREAGLSVIKTYCPMIPYSCLYRHVLVCI